MMMITYIHTYLYELLNKGKPPGYDRARGKEIGKKNIELTTMEEAFTSEHWIVRIYKVKKRPNFETTKLTQKKIKKTKKRKER